MQISQNVMNIQRTDDRCDCTRMHGKATAGHTEPCVSIGHESMNVGGPQQSWHAQLTRSGRSQALCPTRPWPRRPQRHTPAAQHRVARTLRRPPPTLLLISRAQSAIHSGADGSRHGDPLDLCDCVVGRTCVWTIMHCACACMVQILVGCARRDTSAASNIALLHTNALLVVCERATLSPLLQPCAKDIGVIDLPRERV